jgi:hypothetical protein
VTAISGNYVDFSANGSGSLIDLPNLTAVGASSFTARSGGTIEFNGSVTNLTGVSLTVDGQSSLPLDQLISLTDSNVTLEGGTYNLTDLVNINGDNLYIYDGSVLTLPSITGYTNNGE